MMNLAMPESQESKSPPVTTDGESADLCVESRQKQWREVCSYTQTAAAPQPMPFAWHAVICN